jgi:hypothetical protein
MSPDKFHDHLDTCAQCRESPFDLCVAGANLLQVAAEGLPPRQPSKPFNFAPDPYGGPIRFSGSPPPPFYLHNREPRPQNIPIRTELGREIREAFTKPAADTSADYSLLEKRVMDTLNADADRPYVTDVKVSTEAYVCAECGCETNTSMYKPCTACGSVKVVLLSLVEKLFGKNWRECFK